MDLWTYFAQRERECDDMSLVPCEQVPLQFRELAGFEWERGRIVGRLHLTDRAFISLSEEREEAGPISFLDFVEQCWAMVSDLPDEKIDDDYQPSL